ncbi:MAG TPA: ABC transporter ATP-binding protein [Bacillales bacterium]|nr:ABC transporter ATP-binding protein [Bacillales bacterium]
MLQLENVTKTFSEGTTAFRDIGLTARKGEIIGILGTSGCGKSTLLRTISGLDDHYEGTIKIEGEVSRGLNDKIGSIFQEPRLMPWLNVIDNVTFGLKGKRSEKVKAAKRFLRLVGLEGAEGRFPRELSGGMAQRVAIARALVTSPEILLLDEPFSALDAFTKMKLQDLLLDIWAETKATLVIVTHDIDEALHLCDRVLILRGQPGAVFKEIKVSRKRPRARGDNELAIIKEEILTILDLSRSVHNKSQEKFA